jgi:predicted RecA/RadA family phage recombinase
MGRKISDGKSVKVTVPENTTIEQGKFYLLDGFLGLAVQSVTTGAGETAEVTLNIEPAEYETSQIDTADAFGAGAKVYWDAVNSRFTTVAADGFFCGIVAEAKDANNVVWLWLAPQAGPLRQAAAQADSAAADVAGIVADFNALLGKLRAANILAQ